MKKIERLEPTKRGIYTYEVTPTDIVNKINEIIDALNALQKITYPKESSTAKS